MRRLHRRRDDRGAFSIESLPVMSVLILILLLMLQYAVNSYAHRVAQSAAEDALTAAEAYGASPASGQSAGSHTLADLGNISHTSVVVTRTATTAEVTVTGDAPRLIPFLPTHITVHLTGPVEHFVGTP